ncbi:hypothetical protein JD969_04780 [Planctomycetota bacterium]|nr:hypothetical protein JD969_04780 [Planctomycetota bacterium]
MNQDHEEDAIGRDAKCFSCEYNLRGLKIDGDCPECGESIFDSIMRVKNAREDLQWVRGLHNARGFVTASAILWVCGCNIGTLNIMIPIKIIVLLNAIAIATKTRPINFADDDMLRYGQWAKSSSIVAVVFMGISGLIQLFNGNEHGGGLLFGLILFIDAVLLYTFCMFGERIAKNLDLSRMMWHVKRVKWVVLAGIALCLLLMIFNLSGASMTVSTSKPMSFLAVISLIVGYIWTITAAVVSGGEIEKVYLMNGVMV